MPTHIAHYHYNFPSIYSHAMQTMDGGWWCARILDKNPIHNSLKYEFMMRNERMRARKNRGEKKSERKKKTHEAEERASLEWYHYKSNYILMDSF